jgi:hypothetical protein
VLLGNGDGSFQPAQSYAAGFNPTAVAVGDFNGDGLPDLAVANEFSGGVSVLLGNGDGSFQPAQSYAAGFNPTAVAVGDFNGDGLPDLAVASLGGGVRVLLGNGDGSFQTTPVSYVAGGPLSAVAVGDFNGDGLPDLAALDSGSNDVSILLNDGSWPGSGGAPGGLPRPRPAPAAADRFAAAALRADGGVSRVPAVGAAGPAEAQRPPVPGQRAPAGAALAGAAELPPPTRLGAAARAGHAPRELTDLVFADLADGAALPPWAGPDLPVRAT